MKLEKHYFGSKKRIRQIEDSLCLIETDTINGNLESVDLLKYIERAKFFSSTDVLESLEKVNRLASIINKVQTKTLTISTLNIQSDITPPFDFVYIPTKRRRSFFDDDHIPQSLQNDIL